MPTDLRGTGLRRDWAGDMSSRGCGQAQNSGAQCETRLAEAPGGEIGQQTLDTGTPQEASLALCQNRQALVSLPSSQTCFSEGPVLPPTLAPGVGGGGKGAQKWFQPREPRAGVGHCERCKVSWCSGHTECPEGGQRASWAVTGWESLAQEPHGPKTPQTSHWRR